MPITMRVSHKTKLGLAAAGLLMIGSVAGASVVHATRPSVEMAPVQPIPVARAARTTGPITLRGQVAEVYGSKFVLQDSTGRMLIDLGPRGEQAALVSPNAAATVQGRYDRGFIRASFLVDPAGNVTQLGPVGHPGHPGHPASGADRGAPPPPPQAPPPPHVEGPSSGHPAPPPPAAPSPTPGKPG